MPDRVCLIHIGTHKTATTSLQLFFYNNKQALRAAGVHLSEAGRYETSPGNHNIAWDMLASGNSRYIPDLLEDLRSSDCRTALITSEDFSLLHARPDALELMAESMRSVGYRPMIVAYLRPQAAFAESMYSERIKHQYVRPWGDYMRTILNTGSYKPDGTQIHLVFQYTRLIEPFVRAFGKENVIVRPYVAGAEPMHVFQDFFSVFLKADPDFAKVPVNFQIQTGHANESLNFLKLLYAAYSALHREKAAASQDLGRELISMVREVEPSFPDQLFGSRFSLVTRGETLEFIRTFAADNVAIAEAYGARIPFTSQADVAPADDPRWERTRIHRAVFDRLLERWMTAL